MVALLNSHEFEPILLVRISLPYAPRKVFRFEPA